MSPQDRLKAWLSAATEKPAAFAARIEYDKSNFHRILNGDLWPTLDLARKIELATGGAIPMQAWADAKASAKAAVA